MKRLSILMLAIAVLVSAGAASYVAQESGTITLGVITYQVDYLSMRTDRLGDPGKLAGDINVLPITGSYGESAGGVLETPAVQNKPFVELIVRDAATAEAQIAALQELRDLGVDGILLTPVPDVEALRDEVERTIHAGIPMAFAYRDIPGINNAAFVGVEPFAFGNAWGRGWMALSAPQAPLNGAGAFGRRADTDKVALFATSLDDPLQMGIIEGFKEAVGDHLLQVVVSADASETANLIAANEGLVGIAVVDHRLTANIVQAVIDAERKISVGVFGAPENFASLTQQKRIKGNVQPDYYPMLLDGLVALKVHLLNGAPLLDQYEPIMWMGTGAIGGGLPAYVRFPYESERQFGMIWYWWFG